MKNFRKKIVSIFPLSKIHPFHPTNPRFFSLPSRRILVSTIEPVRLSRAGIIDRITGHGHRVVGGVDVIDIVAENPQPTDEEDRAQHHGANDVRIIREIRQPSVIHDRDVARRGRRRRLFLRLLYTRGLLFRSGERDRDENPEEEDDLEKFPHFQKKVQKLWNFVSCLE